MPDYTDIEQKSKTAVRPEEEKQETKARNKPAVTGKVKKVKKGLNAISEKQKEMVQRF